MSASLTALAAANARRWEAMHLRAGLVPQFDTTAHRLCAADAKARYAMIARATGVPWWVIAVIHEREAGGPPHFDRSIAQGDPLCEVSRHEPSGRGPFLDYASDPPGQDAFYRGALDALIECPPRAASWKDWSVGGTLCLLEQYNGLGYAAMGRPSPYVWSGSDQYVSGKYIRDHVYDPHAVDAQEGCAPLVARMMAIDASIAFAAAL
jgi:lysozyme family protein